MIKIFAKNEVDFASFGLGGLLPSECTVTEELNGIYELEMAHPRDEWGKWQRIQKDRIIVASTPSGMQPFRIYNVVAGLDQINVNARHIFYDLLDNLCLNINATGTPQAILTAIDNALAYASPFSFATDMDGTGRMSASNVNPIALLLSDDEDLPSFWQIFGGEILRDHFFVEIRTSIGTDRGFQIRYSKNLVGLEVDEDYSEVVTRIMPIDENGRELPEKWVDSSHIGEYANPKIGVFDTGESMNDAQLRQFAQDLLDGGVDLPMVNIKVDFQLLGKTEEYKEFAHLERVQLGDLVTIINPQMNFSKKAKVISTTWDCLTHRFDGIELGDFKPIITSAITAGDRAAVVAQGASTEVKQVYAQISGKQTITNEVAYHCIDGTNPDTATKLFRWNENGLQFSSSGKNGTYKTLIDANGNFVT